MAWKLDGLDLSTLAMSVKQRSAGWSVPGKVGENVSVPGRNGAFWVSDKRYDEGNLTLSLWANGCNPDGTVPLSMDGRKKVRDNLDALTALFSQRHRLLNLRQSTGTEEALVNEVDNPTLTGTSGSAYPLAHNAAQNGDLSRKSTKTIARNWSPNPNLKGRKGYEYPITEDLYPDPKHLQHAFDQKTYLMRGYTYPIMQDVAFTNPCFVPANGFTYTTQGSDYGTIKRTAAVTYPSKARFGGWRVSFPNARNPMFLAGLRLSTNYAASTLAIEVNAGISTDGTNWTYSSATTYTLNKNEVTDIVIPHSKVPPRSGNSPFFVIFTITTGGGTTWPAGNSILVNYASVQDAPSLSGPWVDAITKDHMIVGGTTPRIESGGTDGRAWSIFNQVRVPEWQPGLGERDTQNTQYRTAPYAFAWQTYNETEQEGRVNFSTLGGTFQTFRRVLATPTTMQASRIWGTCFTYSSQPVTIKLFKRGANLSSSILITSVSVAPGATSFFSPAMYLTPDGSYFLEVEVPSGDGGLNPSFALRELHVSNALIDTNLSRSQNKKILGPAARVVQEQKFSSSILGYGYRSSITDSDQGGYGVVLPTAQSWSASVSDWDSEPGGVISEFGSLNTSYIPISVAAGTKVTVRPYLSTVLLPHQQVIDSPYFQEASMYISVGDSEGNAILEETTTVSGITSHPNYVNKTITVPANAAFMVVYLSHDTATFRSLKMDELHIISDLPNYVFHFTGSNITVSDRNRLRSSVWDGKAFFSTSSMRVAIPEGWTIPELNATTPTGQPIFRGSFEVPYRGDTGSTYSVGLRAGTIWSGSSVVLVRSNLGSTNTNIGTITSPGGIAQGKVPIPAGTTSLIFSLSVSLDESVAEVYALDVEEPVYGSMSASNSWKGFSVSSFPAFTTAHPEGVAVFTNVKRKSNNTLTFYTDKISGWEGPIIRGGFIAHPLEDVSITSNPVMVSGGYVYLGANVYPIDSSWAPGSITFNIMGSSDIEYQNGQSTILDSYTILGTTPMEEVKIVNVPVGDKTRVWIEIAVDGDPSSTGEILASMQGVALVPFPTPLDSDFPGYFTGALNPDGQTVYSGNIRQCWVEVTDAIDMESMALGTLAEFNVSLKVPGSFWEDVYETTTEVNLPTPTATSGKVQVFAMRGATAPMDDLVFEVKRRGSGTGFTRFTLTDPGSNNTITYSGPAQQKVQIEAATGRILAIPTSGNATSVVKHIQSIGTAAIMSLSPYMKGPGEVIPGHIEGTPLLEISSDVPVTVTITGRRKYLIG